MNSVTAVDDRKGGSDFPVMDSRRRCFGILRGSVERREMIRRKEEIRVRTVQGAQGGKGEVTFHDWLLPEEAKGHGRVFSTLVIPPGASIGYHEHQGEFEAFYVMEGVATVQDGDHTVELYPGDMTLCPDGNGHGTENRGDEDLVLMALIMNQLD